MLVGLQNRFSAIVYKLSSMKYESLSRMNRHGYYIVTITRNTVK